MKEINHKASDYWQEACIKCKKCCKVMVVETVYPAEPYYVEYFQTRGFEVLEHPSGRIILRHWNIPCPNLSNKEGEGCLIYPNRPQTCRDYDGRELGNECLWNFMYS